MGRGSHDSLVERLASALATRARGILYKSFSSLHSGERSQLPPEVAFAIEQYVKPGHVVADIGANRGACALRFARNVGHGGRVHCFEPGPPFFESLKRTVSKVPEVRDVCQLYRMGLSDKPCSLKWKQYEKAPGKANLTDTTGLEVEVTTLDSVVNGSWARLDFIKVEVEGMELEVFKGGKETLTRYRPVLLFESLMDFETYRNAPIRKELVSFLKSLGYELYRLDAKGRKASVDYPNLTEVTLGLPTAH